MSRSAKDRAMLYHYMYKKQYAYFNDFTGTGQEDGIFKNK